MDCIDWIMCRNWLSWAWSIRVLSPNETAGLQPECNPVYHHLDKLDEDFQWRLSQHLPQTTYRFSWLFNCQLQVREVMKVSELFITSWSGDAQVHWFKLCTVHYRRFVAKFAVASSNNFSLLHIIPVATQLVKFQLRNAWSRFISMQINLCQACSQEPWYDEEANT